MAGKVAGWRGPESEVSLRSCPACLQAVSSSVWWMGPLGSFLHVYSLTPSLPLGGAQAAPRLLSPCFGGSLHPASPSHAQTPPVETPKKAHEGCHLFPGSLLRCLPQYHASLSSDLPLGSFINPVLILPLSTSFHVSSFNAPSPPPPHARGQTPQSKREFLKHISEFATGPELRLTIKF